MHQPTKLRIRQLLHTHTHTRLERNRSIWG